MKGCILVTGGAGYIGSHTVVELLNNDYDVVVVDNLVNSSIGCIHRCQEITGKKIQFVKVDLLNKSSLEDVFKNNSFSAVMHFAGLKAVGESCQLPFMYYHNNLIGVINLIELMEKYNVKKIIFSSSATVYGNPTYNPIDESHPTGDCTSPYGRTKYFTEEIIRDMCAADKGWSAIILRYFNPVGSHKSGLIGEDPSGLPNNLMPYMAQVAIGRRPFLNVFGDDYETPDGTGVRDYIHITDLAIGHVISLKRLQESGKYQVYNLGTGRGYSVLEMIRAFEKASGKKIDYKIVDRRVGDVASMYANPQLAAQELGWKADRDLDAMCEDLWRWQSSNPHGFQTNGVA